MTKPITDHYGAYVTEPTRRLVWYSDEELNNEMWGGYYDQQTRLELGILYASREAAEMALIRAKCLRRLKEVAYGDGWLPKNEKDGFNLVYDCDFGMDVRFKTLGQMRKAEESLTPEEKAAFLYVYKEKKGK